MQFDLEVLTVQLKRHEGLRLKSYQDSVGVWTAGYGRNLQAMKITQKEADKWLNDDIAVVAHLLEYRFPIINKLSENRKLALLNMAFNLGIKGLSKFKKMWKAIERGNYKEASKQMKKSKWHNQVGIRAVELELMMREG